MIQLRRNLYIQQIIWNLGSTPRTFSNFPTIYVLRGLLYLLSYLISFHGNLDLMAEMIRRSLDNRSLSTEPSGTLTLSLSFR